MQNGCLLRDLRALIESIKNNTIMWVEKHDVKGEVCGSVVPIF